MLISTIDVHIRWYFETTGKRVISVFRGDIRALVSASCATIVLSCVFFVVVCNTCFVSIIPFPALHENASQRSASGSAQRGYVLPTFTDTTVMG